MKSTLFITDEKTLQILAEIKKRAVKILEDKIVKIILYGSYAKNMEDKAAGMDIMIVVNESDENMKRYKDKLIDLSCELSMKYDILISIIFKNKDHFNRYLKILPFYIDIEKEGFEV